MNVSKRFALFILVSSVLGLVAVLAFLTNALDKTPGTLAIKLIATTNSAGMPGAIFQLINSGTTEIAIDEYGAVYWTNQAGIPTNSFVYLNLKSPTLKSGQSVLVVVAPPAGTKVWNSSFSYSPIPGACRRFWLLLKRRFKGDSRLNGLEQPLSCRLSPTITNSFPTSEGN